MQLNDKHERRVGLYIRQFEQGRSRIEGSRAREITRDDISREFFEECKTVAIRAR